MIYILMVSGMWLVVVLVIVLAVIGGYIIYLLLQKKIASFVDVAVSDSSKSSVFAQDLAMIQIKHPVLGELKAALQQHIMGMDGFINALLTSLLVKGHVLVE